MMKVALIHPPLSGHAKRGTGSYTQQLFEALKKRKDWLDVRLIQYTDNQDGFDLVHYPYFDPFFLTLPFIRNKPTVVTVHDLIPLKFPNEFPKGIKGTVKWMIQKLSLLSTSATVTDSYTSQKDILQFTWVPKDKIHVVRLAAGNEFRKVKEVRFLQSVRKKFKLQDDFILHVGDVNYNKNITGLIKAFLIVHKQIPKLQLVLVGKGFQQNSAQLGQLLKLVQDLRLQQCIRRLGYVTLKDLILLYNLARVYVQPSFAEGFGLPVLEAMACGCPVIASDTSSLSEIIGEAAIKINPYKEDELAAVIVGFYQDAKKQEEYKTKGLLQSKKFSWNKTAEQTIKVYNHILK